MHEEPLKKIDLKEASNANLFSTIEILKVLIAFYELQTKGFSDSNVVEDGVKHDIAWVAHRRRYLKHETMLRNLSLRKEAILDEMKGRGLI